ncbi:helix-turn-helix transcriptional regulator [Chitinophaga sedimenti]|uniref:winged helix-turn-helix transcriptional regulator n=1 Tax=Chitinophaga sedimenti TaxID=2033606 RepID=UPI002005BE32|nr:helix-turn-helix domain-containing protein [Chitinophaga sedimenti]MCK7556429.1 helix-turn-helix transcriptional regulator [Chitinophaga sedimenti]
MKTALYLQVVKKVKDMRSACPLNFGLELFGDKWTLLIIRDLLLFGKRHFNEILSSEEGISTNILADRLAMLEAEKVVKKRKDPEHKQKMVYSLTDKGRDLLPVILAIGEWSGKYAAEVLPRLEVVREIVGGLKD